MLKFETGFPRDYDWSLPDSIQVNPCVCFGIW